MMIDSETVEFLEKLQAWHQHKTKQLQLILDHGDADINVADIPIPANSDMAKGLRIGIMLALEYLGKLPFTIDTEDEEQEDTEA